MSSRWELIKHRDLERLQMAAATERALEEQREAQARQCKERETEKVCRFTGAEPEGSLKIIQTWILGLMGQYGWWQPCVSRHGAHCMRQSLECWNCTAESHHQGC